MSCGAPSHRPHRPHTSVAAAAASAHGTATGRALAIVERMLERGLIGRLSIELHGRVGQNGALLGPYGSPSAALPFSDHPRLALGQSVVAVGYPLQGLLASSLNVTSGTVSALAGLGDDSRHVQITAPVQPGNSGGPLFDQGGNVIGVVTSKLNVLAIAAAVGDVPRM